MDNIVEYIEHINKVLESHNIDEKLEIDTSSLECLEGKDIVDRSLYNLLSNHIEDKHKIYKIISQINGEDLDNGYLVLEKELPTGDMIEVMYYNIFNDSIYLYCGIPRYNVKDNDKHITYFHYLERKLKKYVDEELNIEENHSKEEYILDHYYRTYIIEALEKVLEICKDNTNIKNIRIDSNKSFSNRINSILMEIGFVLLPVDYPERISFLKDKYPDYDIPLQINQLFDRYPDREIAYNEHVDDLKDRLELIKNMYVEEDYQSDNFTENESKIVEDFNNSLQEEEKI